MADNEDVDRTGTAETMTVLAALDKTTNHLDTETITVYELQAQHARHLLSTHGLDRSDVEAAEQDHRDAGDRGYAGRGFDHAIHPHYPELPEIDL